MRFTNKRVIQFSFAVCAAALSGSIASSSFARSRMATEKPVSTEKLDYSRDIRPILANKCFQCHGADPKAIQAGLRLDARDGAVKLLASGRRAIVGGKPAQSELLERINSKGPLQMPPAGSNKVLTDEDRKTLARWIREGAEYRPHWAFVPPIRPALPKVRHAKWPLNGIDYFVVDKLERENLAPSQAADRATLIRRVTLDLTGLPPSPDEVDTFVSDRSPKAYEKVVDRLLASPRYGEMMASSWMDCSRYADSNGYQADYERFQWPWRDWVIDAFNKNMPFDEFTIEQIAGDLLPNATTSQKIATGFNRNHRINTEGGVIPEEWRVETVIDRVETTGAVWLGLTIGCGRCHDHKYDPITQREFYQFCSFFNNVPETGTGVEQPVNHPPIMKAPTSDQTTRLASLDSDLGRLNDWLAKRESENRDKAAAWTPPTGGADSAGLTNGLIARYRLWPSPVTVAGTAPTARYAGKIGGDAGRVTGAVDVNNGAFVDLGNVGDFDTKDSFSYGAWIYSRSGDGVPLSKMDSPNDDYRGWDLFVSGARVSVHIIHKWPDDALKVTSKAKIPLNTWTHLLVTYDGSAKSDGVKLYINGKVVETAVEANGLRGTIKNRVTTKVGTRTGSSPFDGKVDDVVLFNRVLSPDDALRLADADPLKTLVAIPPEKRTADQKHEISRFWSLRYDPDYAKQSEEQTARAKERTDLDASIPTVMVMAEMPKPRDCYVLIRGQYDKHGDVVTAGIPAAFGSLPEGASNNRLGLARWIASPTNPLTARVAVNRMWEHFFGIAIVSTTEDFGTRAEYPSNPQLLDWLATEFVRRKWDVKAMQKLIVMSATYKQSSNVTPAIVTRDPENRLLSHGPRFRLPAEAIRDQALAISGLLVEKIGGPSVRPYQPAGVWDELSVYGNLRNYKHDTGDNLHRRSLYTIWKRTAAPPLMSIFDVPGRDTCRVRRSRTNTPLQALVMLNDVTFVEAARAFAQRILVQGGATPEKRVTYAFRVAVGRRPTPAELKVLVAGLNRHIAKYRSDPKAATQLIAIGDAPLDTKIDAAELAAYTLTADVILNMDETLTKE